MTLDELALKHKTDKASGQHDYARIYERYFAPLRDKPICLVECGVGGYEYPDRGGQSLRMWYDYFQRGKIIGVDLHEKTGIINDRTEFWQGSQDDANLMKAIFERQPVNIFIDDASHMNGLTIATFHICYPLLAPGGYYVIEDIHTSFWEDPYNGNAHPESMYTTAWGIWQISQQLHRSALSEEYYMPHLDDLEFVHIYPEMAIIKKKDANI